MGQNNTTNNKHDAENRYQQDRGYRDGKEGRYDPPIKGELRKLFLPTRDLEADSAYRKGHHEGRRAL